MRIFVRWLVVISLLTAGLVLTLSGGANPALAEAPARLITGSVYDPQGQPVSGAEVSLHFAADGEHLLAETATQPDGRYTLSVPGDDLSPDDGFALHIERPHFAALTVPLDRDAVETLNQQHILSRPDVTLVRHIGPAFWVATLVFLAVLAAIAVSDMHNTLAALLGAAVVLAASYLGHPFREDLFIYDFDSAMTYVDWNVIFLVMGMMMVVAVVERTGLFQWLAFFAYRMSRGKVWLLLSVLMLAAGLASAFLDNVTTMLLMTPITVQIALALGIHPLALLIPEVMTANVLGVSTLVGTPTNILIGSYGEISFNQFLVNLTPGVLLALFGLIAYSLVIYRRDLHPKHGASPALMARLAEQSRIDEPETLKKIGWVGGAMLVAFVFGENIHLLPAVTALAGATVLLVWVKPDVEAMISAVDWTTLMFIIALFMVVGAIQEVGLISLIAEQMGRMVGDNLTFAMLAIIWLGAILSAFIANIPFTAAMLPVIGYLTTTIPGAESKALFFCLSVGSAMGGNGSLIGASANLVTAGIAERAGYPITYMYFLKKGFPALLVTVSLATVWLLIRFPPPG